MSQQQIPPALGAWVVGEAEAAEAIKQQTTGGLGAWALGEVEPVVGTIQSNVLGAIAVEPPHPGSTTAPAFDPAALAAFDANPEAGFTVPEGTQEPEEPAVLGAGAGAPEAPVAVEPEPAQEPAVTEAVQEPTRKARK